MQERTDRIQSKVHDSDSTMAKAKAAIQEDIDRMQFQNLRALMYRSLVRIEVSMHMEDVDYFNEGDNDE